MAYILYVTCNSSQFLVKCAAEFVVQLKTANRSRLRQPMCAVVAAIAATVAIAVVAVVPWQRRKREGHLHHLHGTPPFNCVGKNAVVIV